MTRGTPAWPPTLLPRDDSAVSPVIGVILMVAITVVLAAVVFVLVTGIGGDSAEVPVISFAMQQSQASATVVSAPQAVHWEQMDLIFEEDGKWSLNGQPPENNATVGEASRMAGGRIQGGDRIYVCRESGVGPLTVGVRYVDMNLLLETLRFTNVQQCPP